MFHSLSAEAVLARLQTSARGLPAEEAAERLRRFGENTLGKKKRGGAFKLFLAQFKDFMTVLLICAAAVSAAVAFFTEDMSELADTGILLLIILMNTFVGFIQQYRADSAVEKLKKLSVCRAKTVRGGKELLLDGTQLVPGDIVLLEEGDMVPADCRVLQCDRLRCDESALTGESHSVSKTELPCAENAPVAERRCMLYSSTFVVHGQAKAVVTHTGAASEIGKIAGLLRETEAEKTPLEKVLALLGKIVTAAVVAVAAVIFLFGVFFKDVPLLHNFMAAVAVAVAAIPEGLPAIVTVIMALGVQKMSRERAIVRRLHAVETLGGCSCICSDKTGTLTENRMTVEALWTPAAGEEAAFAFAPAAAEALCACMLACHSVRSRGGKPFGDPTEVALVRFLQSKNFSRPVRRLGCIPFDSERRMMTVAAAVGEERCNYVKGAADVLVSRCDRIFDGAVRPMTVQDRERILAATAGLSARALRVLGFAYSPYRGRAEESGLVFLGLCGMIDPPRKGVKEAVSACRTAGVLPVMITGDHRATAFAIARRLGIAESEAEVIEGAELDAMDEAELDARVPRGRVFARVGPRHKSMIVGRFQKAGHVVAMTGDGINDAPGIRKADIGIAMGLSGTDVTKSAADMVIADDDFTTIVAAVREGRHVFANVKKTIRFFLATNLAEVLAILAVSLALYSCDFLTSTQLLWINLITDSLPVLSLGAEGAERDVMARPPDRAADLFSPASLCSVAVYGAMQAAVCVGTFLFCLHAYGNAVAVTVTFFVLSFLELFHSFNIRSERGSAFGRGFFKNKMLFVTVGLGVAVNLALCAFPPLRAAFSVVPLTAGQWALVFAASFSVVPLAELYKAALRLAARRKKDGNAAASPRRKRGGGKAAAAHKTRIRPQKKAA